MQIICSFQVTPIKNVLLLRYGQFLVTGTPLSQAAQIRDVLLYCSALCMYVSLCVCACLKYYRASSVEK